MHRIPQIRKTSIVTLLVLSMLGFGMQTLNLAKEAECQCVANSTEDSGSGIATASCCSQKVESNSPCCCNPNAAVCNCGDCRCGEKDLPTQPSPAIPTNETNEVVSPTLIFATSKLDFPIPCELKKLSLPKIFSTHASLSSQQTCVLLSRFTC